VGRYAVDLDPELSAEAQDLAPELLDAEVTIAEIALGFLDVPWTAADLPLATKAIVLQVNHQISDPELPRVAREKRGDQEIQYRGDLTVDPTARLLAATLLTRYASADGEPEEWRCLTSLR
jgi:hypothetical protein